MPNGWRTEVGGLVLPPNFCVEVKPVAKWVREKKIVQYSIERLHVDKGLLYWALIKSILLLVRKTRSVRVRLVLDLEALTFLEGVVLHHV